MFCMLIFFCCCVDGTLAERVVLGKRRREQLGIQTASDRQHQQSLSPRSNIASGAFAGSGPKHLAVAAAPGAVDHSGPGRPVGVAESMMQKWGYTEGETCAFAVHAQMHTISEKLRCFYAMSIHVFVRLSSCSCPPL
jgi:hypothetical protein